MFSRCDSIMTAIQVAFTSTLHKTAGKQFRPLITTEPVEEMRQ